MDEREHRKSLRCVLCKSQVNDANAECSCPQHHWNDHHFTEICRSILFRLLRTIPQLNIPCISSFAFPFSCSASSYLQNEFSLAASSNVMLESASNGYIIKMKADYCAVSDPFLYRLNAEGTSQYLCQEVHVRFNQEAIRGELFYVFEILESQATEASWINLWRKPREYIWHYMISLQEFAQSAPDFMTKRGNPNSAFDCESSESFRSVSMSGDESSSASDFSPYERDDSPSAFGFRFYETDEPPSSAASDFRSNELDDSASDFSSYESDEEAGVPSAALGMLENVEMTDQEENEYCGVCQEQMSRELKKLKCGHVYHRECISHWLPRRNSCPLCRRPIHPNIFL